MCGIIGAVGERDTPALLMEGLKRLEYRGYDSAGMAVINSDGSIHCRRTPGKIAALSKLLQDSPIHGKIGIGHTRWATHGAPDEINTHPILSADEVAVAHNGIIENFAGLREELRGQGYSFSSDTDTEVIAHLIHREYQKTDDFAEGVRMAVGSLRGSYALVAMHKHNPGELVAFCGGCPMVAGVGIGENFVASDVHALHRVTDSCIYLEEGDLLVLHPDNMRICDRLGGVKQRPFSPVIDAPPPLDQGPFRHHVEKEIHEQPQVADTLLRGRIRDGRILDRTFGPQILEMLEKTEQVTLMGCGSSYYAGCVASHWMESIGKVMCSAEISSEYRYRETVVPQNALMVAISQSGETADTIAALRSALERKPGYFGAMTICNVAMSTLARMAPSSVLMEAGPEISVASTKTMTSQLMLLLMLSILLGRRRGLDRKTELTLTRALQDLPKKITETLRLDAEVKRFAQELNRFDRAIFLGRGTLYAMALEGTLKLKELSYMHAEAYPSGELKHGPLAVVDSRTAVIAMVANNALAEKLVSNLQEVRAREGAVYVFADEEADLAGLDDVEILRLPAIHWQLYPILCLPPLQLLAYHVALLRGTDVDQPRNLAKSVTVE